MGRPEVAPGYPPSGVVDGDWDDLDGPQELFALAADVGGYVWSERRLHRVLGSWATGASDPSAVATFDRVALRHAWRAEVLFARLPQLRELPADALVLQPVGGDGAAEPGSADGPSASDGTDADRCASWSADAEHLLDGYRALLARTTPVADAPLQRWLPLVIASLAADLADVGALRTRFVERS